MADMRIRGSDRLELSARSVRFDSFTLKGLLPEPLEFLGEIPSIVDVARFRLDKTRIEVHDAYLAHPDLEAHVDRFALDVGAERLPVDADGQVTIRSPFRVEQVTMGHVFGAMSVRFRLFGFLTNPDFEFRVKSDRLMAEGLELEDVDAQTVVDLSDGLRILVPSVDASLMGSDVTLRDTRILVGDSGYPEIFLDGCFEGLRPALLALAFGVEDLLPFADLVASGCCHGCRVRTSAEGVQLDGGVSVIADSPTLAGLSGVEGGAVDTFLSFDGRKLTWEGLSVMTNLGHISAAGALELGSPLSGRVKASLSLTDLESIPLFAFLGMGGAVTVDDLVLHGTVEEPEVELSASVDNLSVAGEVFDSLTIKGGYGAMGARLDSLCFVHGVNQGCLSAMAHLPGRIADIAVPFPVRMTVDDPLTVDLSRLPYVKLPVRGQVTMGPATAELVVLPEPLEMLASLELDTMLALDNFELPAAEVSLGRLSGHFSKHAVGPDDLGIGPMDGSLEVQKLSVPGVRIRETELDFVVDRFPGLFGDPAATPFVVGGGYVGARGISGGKNSLTSVTINLEAEDEPRRVVFKGRAMLTPRVGVSFDGDLLTEELLASLQVAVDSFPLVILPPNVLDQELRELFAETRVTARVATTELDVNALLEGRVVRAFKRLKATGDVKVAGLETLPEPISQIDCRFSLGRGRVRLRPATVRLRNGTRVTINGSVTPLSKRLDTHISVTQTRLSSSAFYYGLRLPLDGKVAAEMNLAGTLAAPEVEARLVVSELEAAGVALGDAVLLANGRVGETIEFGAESFFEGFQLSSGSLSFAHSAPEKILLDLSFEDFDLTRVLPTLPSLLRVKADGTAAIRVDLASRQDPFVLTVDIPARRLSAKLDISQLPLDLSNPTDSRVIVNTRGIFFEGLSMVTEGYAFSADGGIEFVKGWDLHLGAGIDLSRIALLGDSLASYSGRVILNKEQVHLTGALDNPRVTGNVLLDKISLQPRQLGAEISIPASVIKISGELLTGKMLAFIEEDVPLAGTYDEGTFAIYGWLRIIDWAPATALLNLSGKEIYYNSPGQFRLSVSPRLELRLDDLAFEEKARGKLSGEVYVSEGEFTRNFDQLIGSFSTAFSRSQERYSKPITETIPFLKNIDLDLRVRGGNFAVSSRFPFGETELAVNLDLKVGGTLDDLKLWDWMHLVPGGTITYKLVKRVFTVNQGAVDFSGDPGKPHIDVEAQTDVPYAGGDDMSGLADLDEEMWGNTVPIKVRLTGTYPNLTPEFSTDKPGFDAADLQTLLLLGMTRKQLEQSSDEEGPDISVNLLTDEVANMVSKLVLSAFVDSVSLGLTEGGVLAEAATKIGRAINLSTKVKQTSDEQEYTARIQFKITDRLSLEGRMRRKSIEGQEGTTGYEAKFRYLIPLD